MTLEELNRTSSLRAGTENTAFAPYSNGISYLNMLLTEQVSAGCITFAPGCRNHRHIHHTAHDDGQILLVTAGRGWYQEWGEAFQALRSDDVVNIPPNVEHWHGATANNAFRHLAVEVPGEGFQNRWCEPVDAMSYRTLKALTGGTDNQWEVFYGTESDGRPGRARGSCPQIRPTR